MDKRSLSLVLCAAFAASTPVLGADSSASSDFTLTAGAKAWENSWQSWIVVPTVFNRASRQIVEPISSSTEVAAIPQISARYGSWLGAVSTLIPTDYTLNPSYGRSLAASRSEWDANVGYYLLPGLAVTAGYKQLEQKFGGTFKWHGPTLGLSGVAGLGKGFSLYGTVGYGYMKADLPFPDGADQTSLDATYALSEAGVVYSIRNLGTVVRSLNLTLGYRSQTLTTKGYGLLDSNVPPTVTRQDVRDITQGFTISAVAVF